MTCWAPATPRICVHDVRSDSWTEERERLVSRGTPNQKKAPSLVTYLWPVTTVASPRLYTSTAHGPQGVAITIWAMTTWVTTIWAMTI